MKNKFYHFKFKKTLIFFLVLFFASGTYAQTRSWLGTADNNWKTNSNWSDSIIPDKNTDVIIETACSFYPILDNTEDTCKSITIKDGAVLNMILGGNLTVIGDFIIGEGSSGIYNGDCGQLKVLGNLILNDSASVSITDSNIICTDAVLSLSSTVTYMGGNMTVNNWNYGNLVLSGSGVMQITGDLLKPTTCNNLTVNNTGNSLEIPVNKALTVNGTLTNNVGTSGIVLKSGPLGDGSLICSTTNINADIKRYITGNRWHYLASPIDTADASIFTVNNLLWWDASEEWTGAGDYTPWKGYNTNLVNANGYAYYSAEDTLDFQGNINVGNYTVTLHKSATGTSDYQGWNLIGNPYTAVLNWDSLVADGAIPLGAENAIYFFDDETGDGSQSNYRYYVPSTGGTYGVGTADATGDIPLGQAFFIKTNTDNITLTLNKNYRVHNTQKFYKNKTSEIIKLRIEGKNNSDEMIFRIVPDASLDFDAQFDACKIFSGDENIPQIYSYAVTENNKIAINSIPEINDNTELNIGFKAIAGDYTLNFEEISAAKNEMYLYDSYLKTYTDIKKTKKYSFEHKGGEVTDRFILVFKGISSEIENVNTNMITLFPNPAKDFLTIKINENQFTKGTIQIISVTGKICYTSEMKNNCTKINLINFSDGMYFLKLYKENYEPETYKFLVRK
ncbi:MAG: T9SS type A sorting domain-containing protein [Chlorobi bacterium]|nr:T9SS type A sorting domain-containing protein [Chlorobiota bacterium]